MADFVIRQWTLTPADGEQAPLHVHHRGDEAFCVIDGLLDVQDGADRLRLEPGELHVVRAGRPHTFATVGQEQARLFVVMTPEIDELVRRLHSGEVTDLASLWAQHHSSLVG